MNLFALVVFFWHIFLYGILDFYNHKMNLSYMKFHISSIVSDEMVNFQMCYYGFITNKCFWTHETFIYALLDKSYKKLINKIICVM